MSHKYLYVFGLILIGYFILTMFSNMRTLEGFSSSSSPDIYEAPNGSTAVITDNSVVMTTIDGKVVVFSTEGTQNQEPNKTVYVNENGGTMTVYKNDKGDVVIKFVAADKTLPPVYFTVSYQTVSNQSGNVLYSANGTTAKMYGDTIYIKRDDGSVVVFTLSSAVSNMYHSENGNAVAVLTIDNDGDKTLKVRFSNGETVVFSNNTVLGVHRDQIPNGDEDLYILKSQIVVPTIPACPSQVVFANPSMASLQNQARLAQAQNQTSIYGYPVSTNVQTSSGTSSTSGYDATGYGYLDAEPSNFIEYPYEPSKLIQPFYGGTGQVNLPLNQSSF